MVPLRPFAACRWIPVVVVVLAFVFTGPCVALAQNAATTSSASSDPGDPADTCREQVEKRAFYIAMYHCDRAIEADSTRAALYVLRGRAYIETDRLREGLADLETAISLDETHPPAYFWRGDALHQLGRVQESIESVQQAIDLAPERAEYHSVLGRFYESQSRYEKALEAYNAALAIDTTASMARSNRGVLLRDQFSDLEGAIRDFNVLETQLDKPSRRARNYVARGRARLQQLNEGEEAQNRALAAQAEVDFSGALELFPEYVQARLDRGRAREAQYVNGDSTRVDDAIRDYTDVTKMIGTVPQSIVARAYLRRGIMYASKGDQQTATESITRAARLGMKEAADLLDDRGIDW